MSVVDAILSFDGKHVDELKFVVMNGISDTEWHQVATYFLHPDTRLQTSSSWLVKTALEHSMLVPNDVVQKLILNADQLSGWEPKLHLLQSVQFIDCCDEQAEKLLEFIETCETDTKTLVRVWALDAYVRLKFNDEEGTDAARGKLQLALEDNAASMRARARNLCKEFPQLAPL